MLGFAPFLIPVIISNSQNAKLFHLEQFVAAMDTVVYPAFANCSLTHFWLLKRGHRTLGRYLFQLRITEQHGLLCKVRVPFCGQCFEIRQRGWLRSVLHGNLH